MNNPGKLATVLAGLIILLLVFVFPKTNTTENVAKPSDGAHALDKASKEESAVESVAVMAETPQEGQLEDISAQEIEDSAIINSTSDIELTNTDQLTDFQMMNPESAGIGLNETGQEFVKTVSPINWQSARQHERLPSNHLSDEQSTLVAASKVPVLLPNNLELLDEAIVSVGGEWYAASMSSGEVNVLVNGTSVTVAVPGSESGQVTTLENYSDKITKSLGMVEVSFSAYGVNYNIVVECYSHETDPACLENEYIDSIVSNLLLAEGDNNEDGA